MCHAVDFVQLYNAQYRSALLCRNFVETVEEQQHSRAFICARVCSACVQCVCYEATVVTMARFERGCDRVFRIEMLCEVNHFEQNR